VKASQLRVIVTGLIAQHPTLGGVAWDYLQYAVGLARLGHDVYYFEDSGEGLYSLDGGPSGDDWVLRDPTPNLVHLAAVMSRYGLGEKWAYFFPLRSRWYGLSHRRRREVIDSADLLINVSGTLRRPENYRRIPRLAYIDSDPVFTQIKLALKRGFKKFQRRFQVHDIFFTFGDRIPATNTARPWLPTRQPILLSEWNAGAPRREAFTTVMSWTSYKPLRFQRARYGQKDIEFKRFLDLPSHLPHVQLEVALGGGHHPGWQSHGSLPVVVEELLKIEPDLTPSRLLPRMGWHMVDPVAACGTLDSYRHYIESSKAEWSVAKNGYVAGTSGWFSCRSACYLAAGRPVVVQDTGSSLPTGEGVVTFSNVSEAAEAVRQVESNYRRHAKAARDIGAEYFDSSKVLGLLLDQAMASHPSQTFIAA
jgi:hypothetical protein